MRIGAHDRGGGQAERVVVVGVAVVVKAVVHHHRKRAVIVVVRDDEVRVAIAIDIRDDERGRIGSRSHRIGDGQAVARTIKRTDTRGAEVGEHGQPAESVDLGCGEQIGTAIGVDVGHGQLGNAVHNVYEERDVGAETAGAVVRQHDQTRVLAQSAGHNQIQFAIAIHIGGDHRIRGHLAVVVQCAGAV